MHAYLQYLTSVRLSANINYIFPRHMSLTNTLTHYLTIGHTSHITFLTFMPTQLLFAPGHGWLKHIII